MIKIFIVKKEKKYYNDKKIDGIKNLSSFIGKKGEINLRKNIFVCEKEKKDKLYRKDAYLNISKQFLSNILKIN